ncbi:hypothetical protein BT96DRAFT_813532, partial [Gymnopus androsaceus JB14]
RVWRACQVCRKRKVKCNGQEPCAYCLSSGKACSFKDINDNAASARQQTSGTDYRLARVEETLQKLVPITQAFEAWLRANHQIPPSGLPIRVDPDDASFNSHSPYPTHSPPQDDRPSSSTSYRASNSIKELCANDGPEQSFTPQGNAEFMDQNASYGPEKWVDRYSHLTKDSYGQLRPYQFNDLVSRYTGGPTSDLIADAITISQNPNPADASPESILSTKSDVQLPFFAPDRTFRRQAALPLPEDITYPPSELADELVATYFSRIHYTFPILHQQGFVERYIQVMEQKAKGKQPSKDHGFLSALFAVFACGACLIEKGRPKSGGQGEANDFRGFEFYEKAQLFFWMGIGTSQIEHVQCLSIMAICNATWNTLAQSWINVGAAVRRGQDLGLHLSGRRLPLTPFEREYRKRIWWCVYGLDRVLSIALGRPNGTHEDDFDIEMRTLADDAQLTALRDGIPQPIQSGKSYMTGFVALLSIYGIAGKIMRFTQSAHVEEARNEKTNKTIADLDSQLANWVHQLPSEVKYAANDPNDPQMFALCTIAFFVYYSAIINLHRPFIPDHATPSSDLSSLLQCTSAARSCIRIGEITQEMLPASHHLAFAVQYITLSAVLLLRSIVYIKQVDLVSAIISDAEKAITILQNLELIWPASKRCREIVSDLLVVVRTKLSGGASAIEALQAAQLRQQESPHEFVSESASTKRKRVSEPGPVASSSRQRLDDLEWTPAGQATTLSNQRYHPSNAEEERYGQQLSNLMRTSSIRTSMSNDAMPSTDALRGHALSNARGDPGSLNTPSFGNTVLPSLGQLLQPPLPQISLDINTLSTGGRHLDEYSGYDFLGDDLFAVLGSVVRPSEQQLSPQTFEENAQVLWQAFHGKPDAPFVAS